MCSLTIPKIAHMKAFAFPFSPVFDNNQVLGEQCSDARDWTRHVGDDVHFSEGLTCLL